MGRACVLEGDRYRCCHAALRCVLDELSRGKFCVFVHLRCTPLDDGAAVLRVIVVGTEIHIISFHACGAKYPSGLQPHRLSPSSTGPKASPCAIVV